MYEIYCKLRDSLWLKDADVAKATGIRQPTFSDWKYGRSTPKLEKRQVIADFFGVSLEYLNTGKESSSEYSLDSSLLFGQIRRDERLCNALTKYFELPDDGKEKILNVLETMINGEK